MVSLTDSFPEVWNDLNLLRISMTRSAQLMPYQIYLWDTQLLAKKVGEIESSGNSNRTIFNHTYYTLDKSFNDWSSIWIDNINDDSGSRIYEKMDTGFTVSLFNRYSPINFTYTGSLSFSPMVAYNTVGDYLGIATGDDNTVGSGSSSSNTTYLTSETYQGEYLFWTAMVLPGIPLLLSSTVPNNQQFGPIFINEATISVSGLNKVSPVQIRVSFSGTRSFRAPVMDFLDPMVVDVNDYVPNPNIVQGATLTDTGDDFFAKSFESEINNSTDSPKYRTAALMDCAISTDLLTSIDDVQTNQATLIRSHLQQLSQNIRLIGMKLNIKQDVKYTAPGPITSLTEQNGPRFVSISGRVVTGSITYLSNQQNIDGYDRSSSLTMYFGGPYIFPMENVEWQRPMQGVRAGEHYVHEIGFIARACSDIVALPGTPANSSEFSVVLNTTSGG